MEDIQYRPEVLRQIEAIEKLECTQKNFDLIRGSLLSYIAMKELDRHSINQMSEQIALLGLELEKQKNLVIFYKGE